MVNRILELFWTFIKIYCVLFVIGDGVTLLTYMLFLNKRKMDAMKLTCVINIFNGGVVLNTSPIGLVVYFGHKHFFPPTLYKTVNLLFLMRQLKLKSERIHEASYGLHF